MLLTCSIGFIGERIQRAYPHVKNVSANATPLTSYGNWLGSKGCH